VANRKLTDAQLVILSAASAREDGLVLPPPKSLRVNRGTQTIVLRGLLSKELIAARPAQRDEEIWETHEDGTRTTLVITDAGLTAIGITPDSEVTPERKPRKSKTAAGSSPQRPKARRGSDTRPSGDAPPAEPAKDSKLGILIAAMRRKKGATIDDLMQATGWQAHSVRGAISGALKKKLGMEVVSEPVDGRGRVYRIDGQRA
jgi:hypothetical protein